HGEKNPCLDRLLERRRGNLGQPDILLHNAVMVSAQEGDRLLVFRIAHDGVDSSLRSRIGLSESDGTQDHRERSDSSKMLPHVTSSTPEIAAAVPPALTVPLS